MIKTDHLHELVGLDIPFQPRLIQSILEFTICFSYAESKYFDEYADGRKAELYAGRLMALGKPEPVELFAFFKDRYINEENDRRLRGLTNDRRRDREDIEAGLKNEDADANVITSTVLRILIRIRHNLFHGNKVPLIMEEPEKQAELLERCIEYLAVLLKK